jgi:hypothetical protein
MKIGKGLSISRNLVFKMRKLLLDVLDLTGLQRRGRKKQS